MNETFDNRTIHHKIRRGELTRSQYNEYLASLPDDAEEGVETETRFAPTFANRSGDEDGEDEDN